MPRISFEKFPPLDVPVGSNLMRVLRDADIPVASSCDGDGVCAKCKLSVLEGAENLSPANEIEIFIKDSNKLDKSLRISCQTLVLGDVKVHASYW